MATRRFVHALILASLLVVTSCGDDSEPQVLSDQWEEATIFVAPSHGALYSLAFSDSLGLAVGQRVGLTSSATIRSPFISPYFVTRASDDTWSQPAGAPFPPQSLISAVGFAPDGGVLMAGVESDIQSGFILDERGGWSRHNVAIFGLALASSPGIVRVAGAAAGNNAVFVSRSPDTWTPESIPFPSSNNERALVDISADDGVFIACGFDDGGDGTPQSPNSVVFRNDGGDWERLELPCGGCANREFRTVAVTPSGSFFLGGAETDFSAGSQDQYQAFPLSSSREGDWTEIVLPEPGKLDRVNDILIATDGDIYLACGVEGSIIVQMSGTSVYEAVLPGTRIAQLAEAPDGSIWAAGAILDRTDESSRPMIWKRTPE
ncbi:MAG: hypothetical protein SGI90_05365 [Candidatus Eisenbacteria bacterium]|nr:hypothetical protein [Candidatus Eisenbacteria bacterium]